MVGFFLHRLRMALWTLLYRVLGRFVFASLGTGVSFEGWVDVPQRGGRIAIGNRVHICRLVEFSVPAGGELVLGDGVFVGRGVVVSAHRKVSIGKDTMLGEFVSIHDNDHRLDKPDLPISQQGFMAEPLEIGASCWIGAKAVLVRGSGMEERCVLGAGAVLTARLAAGTRAVGVPARPLAGRTPSVQS